MDSDELGFMPATALAELIRTKKISPVEYTRALLERIGTLEPKVNAFAHLAGDQAMDAARKAEAALMSGARIGRLHGVPATIKDLVITKDMPTQSGSLIFKDHQPTEDSPVVPRLQAEGAIILGKTTTSEFGWTGVSHSPLTGISNRGKTGGTILRSRQVGLDSPTPGQSGTKNIARFRPSVPPEAVGSSPTKTV